MKGMRKYPVRHQSAVVLAGKVFYRGREVTKHMQGTSIIPYARTTEAYTSHVLPGERVAIAAPPSRPRIP